MLIEFTVGNFRSFHERVTLSMIAASALRSRDKELDAQTVVEVPPGVELLRSAAIYGANASGKSNLVNALAFMRTFVLNSSRTTQTEDPIPVQNFKLSTETDGQPSFFEILFLLDGKRYRYGFEVTRERVIAEWLFYTPKSREARLFQREQGADEETIVISPAFKEGRQLKKVTRSNALFLSVAAQFKGKIAEDIRAWFSQINVSLGVALEMDLATLQQFHEIADKRAILQLIRDLDLGIRDIESTLITAPWSTDNDPTVKEFLEIFGRMSNQTIPSEVPEIKTVHEKYDAAGNVVGTVQFEFGLYESAGTWRLFSLAVPILETLRHGRIMVVDELDARLHPLMTCTIIEWFHNPQTNPHNAQLIFTTHDTTLLRADRFRRDQIWFVEKDRMGASHLYSLAEFKVRNDASFGRDYIQGKYGAIPFIQSDIQALVGAVDGAA
ncbi:MAG TPA: ATP-binding protein [Chloroflexia bacterium]|nr:ATP-binding protein [Chloroflexia bacterium]